MSIHKQIRDLDEEFWDVVQMRNTPAKSKVARRNSGTTVKKQAMTAQKSGSSQKTATFGKREDGPMSASMANSPTRKGLGSTLSKS